MLCYISGMNFAIAILLKPFVLFVLTACVLYPARRAVMRHMKEGQLKDLLLFRIGGDGVKWTTGRAVFLTIFFVLYLGWLILAAQAIH